MAQGNLIRKDIVNGAIQIRKKRVLLRKAWLNVFARILTFVLFFVLCFTFVFGYKTIENNDMYPVVKAGDAVLYLKVGSIINNDIVIYDSAGTENIGRVQATSGTKIGKTAGGLVTIDGNFQPVQERVGLFWETKIVKDGNIEYPSIVPDDSFFILGDERDTAVDSRTYGYINRKDIEGKVFTVIKRRNL